MFWTNTTTLQPKSSHVHTQWIERSAQWRPSSLQSTFTVKFYWVMKYSVVEGSHSKLVTFSFSEWAGYSVTIMAIHALILFFRPFPQARLKSGVTRWIGIQFGMSHCLCSTSGVSLGCGSLHIPRADGQSRFSRRCQGKGTAHPARMWRDQPWYVCL